ncbi:peroxisomal membrane protein 4-like [Lingula anatina]|uniref:Peroxisomal membrane protein 4-like n=1 Tax=Lingula anatina TaxID=7574 RepID=A0A1S3JUQ1_LINAN|nr:peroxisomal membrane protein 4-like [Lingula anatina]|eukprot:XP_013413826.1 peroxisomal membrane protein 4-like [Lingula anatina]
MPAPVVAVNALLASGQYKPLLAILKGFRNGAVYGAKIRAPHSLVMTFLFRSGSLYEKFRAILEATFTHSKNLASFVFGYKTITTLLRWLQSEQLQYHSFIAAFVTGYFVFGKYNKVNEQINLYLLSRILYGLAKLAVKRRYIPEPQFSTFPWFAAIVWGIVLWLFEYERDTLQGSLRSSMTYLYDDSNVWHDITDFLIYNKPPIKN